MTAIQGTKNTTAGWVDVRARRDGLLEASDWTQMPDSPLAAEARAAWAAYRTALRNLPNVPHINQVVWPDAPKG